jgi:hypothetical protein
MVAGAQGASPAADAVASEGEDEGATADEEWIELTDEQVERLRGWIRGGVPVSSEEPVLHDGYAEMTSAEVIVINLLDDAERGLAEETRRQILALYRDWHLRSRLRMASQVVRPGVYVANLQDPTDAGTRAAVAQLKRRLRQR